MINGPNPTMALQACENPRALTNFYSRLTKGFPRLRNENVTRFIIRKDI